MKISVEADLDDLPADRQAEVVETVEREAVLLVAQLRRRFAYRDQIEGDAGGGEN